MEPRARHAGRNRRGIGRGARCKAGLERGQRAEPAEVGFGGRRVAEAAVESGASRGECDHGRAAREVTNARAGRSRGIALEMKPAAIEIQPARDEARRAARRRRQASSARKRSQAVEPPAGAPSDVHRAEGVRRGRGSASAFRVAASAAAGGWKRDRPAGDWKKQRFRLQAEFGKDRPEWRAPGRRQDAASA